MSKYLCNKLYNIYIVFYKNTYNPLYPCEVKKETKMQGMPQGTATLWFQSYFIWECSISCSPISFNIWSNYSNMGETNMLSLDSVSDVAVALSDLYT